MMKLISINNTKIMSVCYPYVYVLKFYSNQRNTSTVNDIISTWKSKFHNYSVDEPDICIKQIIMHVLKIKKIEDTHMNLDKHLSNEQISKVNKLCECILARMPLQYVIGEWDFRDVVLKLRPPVFIPRPETEFLINVVKENVSQINTFLEIGCGSGAISISLLRYFPQSRGFAVDINEAACKLTVENAERCNVNERLVVLQEKLHDDGCLKCTETTMTLKQLDVIVSNPPYLYTSELSNLPEKIKIYEDLRALDGGRDGLRVIKAILKLSSNLLTSGKSCFLEIRHDQVNHISSWLETHDYLNLKFLKCYKDFSNYDRYIHVIKY